MVKVNRRSSNDKQWQQVKEIVYKRDKNSCRLCRVLTIQEFFLLKKNAGPFLNIIDPAHFLEVSNYPEFCYEPQNICCLNRYSHSLLDSFKDPIDGHNISKEEVKDWWLRILKGNKDQYIFLKEKGLLDL